MPMNGGGTSSRVPGAAASPNATIKSADYNAEIDDIYTIFNTARPVAYGGTGNTVGSDRKMVYSAKSASYTAVADDNNAVLRFTASATLSLTAAATLGTNWHCWVFADGGAVTIDPNGSETIDGSATLSLPTGFATLIVCTGTEFRTDKGASVVRTTATQTLSNKTLADGTKIAGAGTSAGTAMLSFRDSVDAELGYVGAASGANAHISLVSGSANVNVTSSNPSGIINLGGSIPADNAVAGISVYKAGSAGGHTLYAINANSGSAMVVGTVSSSTGTIATFVKGGGTCGSISASTTTTTYNTSSDQRLKEGFRDFDAGAIIDQMAMYEFDWKVGGVGYGPKAQELHEVFPLAVTPGNDKEPGSKDFHPWAWAGNPLIALLIREVQSLRQRIAALEN